MSIFNKNKIVKTEIMSHDMIEDIKEIRYPQICYPYINAAGDAYQLYKEVLIKNGLLIL